MKNRIVYIKIPIILKINPASDVKKTINKKFKSDVFTGMDYIENVHYSDITKVLIKQKNIIKTINDINKKI